jgi:hypothetical protein
MQDRGWLVVHVVGRGGCWVGLGSVRVWMDCFVMGDRVESWIPWVLNNEWLLLLGFRHGMGR